MNKITRKTEGIDFDELLNDFIENSYKEHRRGSTFYTKSIVKIDEESYSEIDRKYDGFWETNQYISSEDDSDLSEIYELNRVEIKDKVVTTQEWVKVTN